MIPISLSLNTDDIVYTNATDVVRQSKDISWEAYTDLKLVLLMIVNGL